jgi:hypothetical protein
VTLLKTRDQHHVAVEVAARHCQLFPVEGPRAIKNQFSFEMRELMGRATAQRLFPKVADAVARQHVLQAFRIGRPGKPGHRSGCRKIRQRLPTLGWHDDEPGGTVGRLSPLMQRNHFPVWGDADAGPVDVATQLCHRAAINGNSPSAAAAIGIVCRECNPFAVGRAGNR